MRIGIDCRLWNETGVGRYTGNLVFELGKIDKKNTYVLFFKQHEFNTVDIPGGKFEKKLADVRWHSLQEQISFAKILNRENLDIMHFPYFSVPLLYRRPFVITIHDLILNHYPTGRASLLPLPFYWVKLLSYRFIVAQAAARAKKIIAVSHATKNEIIDHLKISEQKIQVIYEGVDGKISNLKSSLGQTRDKQISNKFTNEKYFLYVGNAYPHKNLELLIQAFKKLQEKHEDVTLVLVGKEDHFYKKLKEQIKAQQLDTKILLYGWATDEELGNLYANALAFVYPSKMEGFGLPILEAMTNRTLVIASDIPVFKEIAGDCALYFTSGNSEELYQKMEEVLSMNENLLKQLIEHGLARVKQFSWEKMAKQTLEVYNSCS